jgi:hypothetical protein
MWGGRVNLRHDADNSSEGATDLPEVLQILEGRGPAAVVFEPILANLIPANLKIPDLELCAFEALAVALL